MASSRVIVGQIGGMGRRVSSGGGGNPGGAWGAPAVPVPSISAPLPWLPAPWGPLDDAGGLCWGAAGGGVDAAGGVVCGGVGGGCRVWIEPGSKFAWLGEAGCDGGRVGDTYASGWVAGLEALVRGLVSSAVLAGAEPTGPRSAVALSMPGCSPTAFPPDGGGGGLNGSAGLAKLVTPGAADGVIACTGALAGIAGADGVNAAAAGGANIPITGG